MRDYIIVTMIVLLPGAAWDRIEPVTSQKVSGLHYFTYKPAPKFSDCADSLLTQAKKMLELATGTSWQHVLL